MVGGEGGILTLPLLASYHVVSSLHENRMNTAVFYSLYYSNGFNVLNRLGLISGLNRHQRHQGLCWPSYFRLVALDCIVLLLATRSVFSDYFAFHLQSPLLGRSSWLDAKATMGLGTLSSQDLRSCHGRRLGRQLGQPRDYWRLLHRSHGASVTAGSEADHEQDRRRVLGYCGDRNVGLADTRDGRQLMRSS
jgi:hypothetical protein